MKLRKILAAAASLFVGTASVLSLTASAEDPTVGDYESLNYTKYDDHIEINTCDREVEGEVVIPAEIDGLPVTDIRQYAFYDCDGMTGITLPDSIVSIGDSAFGRCRGLTEITIPEGVTSIGSLAFSDTKWLEDRREEAPLVIVNNIVVDGEGCEGDIVIPEGITDIAGYAFLYCGKIASVTLPGSVTDIGEHAFSYCSALTEITIPENVTSIGEYAFLGCRGLTSLNLPASLTSIENGVFEECYALTTMTIPENIVSIGENSFASCENLSSIRILNPDCEIYDDKCTFCADYEYNEEESEYAAEIDCVIVGHEGSTAQAYAEKYGYDFKTLSEYENAVPVSEDEGIIVETGDDKGYKGFPVIPLAFLGAGTTIILVGVLSLAKKRKKN